MEWLWLVGLAWVLLSVPIAMLIGRSLRMAETGPGDRTARIPRRRRGTPRRVGTSARRRAHRHKAAAGRIGDPGGAAQ